MTQHLIDSLRDDCRQSAIDFQPNLSRLRNQTLLITGGTGFMGAWLTEMICFLNEEHGFAIKLYLLSRDSAGLARKAPHLATKSFVRFIEEDVRNLAGLPDDIGWVIHAAGTPDNREHASQPLKVMDVAYRGTVALLEACLRLPLLKKVVHISSNYVYGQLTTAAPIAETRPGLLDANSVTAAYAEAKRIGETVCAVYRNQQQLPITIIRPFAFIGPYQGLEKPWAVNNFIRDSMLGGPIRILGDKNTVRSYLYGSDMAYWLLSALAADQPNKTYNLGSADGLTLFALAQKISQDFQGRIAITEKSAKPNKNGNILSSVPDTSAIEQDVNVRQRIPMDSALARTIRWYQTTATNKISF